MFNCTYVIEDGGTAQIAVTGSATIEHASKLYSQLSRGFSEGSAVRLNIDLLEGADLSLLQLVIAAEKTAAELKKSFVVVGKPAECYVKMLDGAGARKLIPAGR